MAYTRELVTTLTDSDYNRLYSEESVDETQMSSLLGCAENEVKDRIKTIYQSAIADDDKYLVGIFEDELLIRLIACYKVYEYDQQQRSKTGLMLTANNSANSKSWQYDSAMATSITPTAEAFHVQQGSIGLIIEAKGRGMYDSLVAGGGAIGNLIEISPWNSQTNEAKFVSDFGFD